MDNIVLEKLMEDAASEQLLYAQNAIDDLEKVIHRETAVKFNPEGAGEQTFHREALNDLRLSATDLKNVTRFLFFLLMNYPDRSASTARCLVKCYDKSLMEGICQAIEVYYLKNDETTSYLTDAITYSRSPEEFGERTLALFRKLRREGLPQTQQTMKKKFAYYSKFYGFEE